ncbi:3,4-dihydroxy-2-butanone-4-phosphate synthase [Rhodococcus sp. 14C212]|uniref:3,4-dihydroxy-2-butanone-4-phosphate synthase n=1 Tax=Rhodococcus sp. 14C212 TaxID=2711209 RepID=UPI0013EB2932|nr:3,4-dihydroxy-2-butanone-4-phosphate synthase [Rhodococcus sp. 14C212]NGP07406.1 3,4-dihydroxy-2-butanone-4-phosphate synthase [Rhodococcus sp. 14C212]
MSIAVEPHLTRTVPASSRPVHDALAALREGLPVLVMDAAERKNEGYAVIAADLATPRWIAWAVRHTSGLICAPMRAERAEELDLPLMVRKNENPRQTAFTVAVDAVDGVTTGISASDRARTLRVLAASESRPADLTRPGHILPLRARPGGVVERPGHTEASVDLCSLAGLPPIAAVAALAGSGEELAPSMASRHEVNDLAARFDLPVLDIADLVVHCLHHGSGLLPRVSRRSTTQLTTVYDDLTAVIFHDNQTGAEHIALLGAIPIGPNWADASDIHPRLLSRR